jgi:hypothetical protein
MKVANNFIATTTPLHWWLKGGERVGGIEGVWVLKYLIMDICNGCNGALKQASTIDCAVQCSRASSIENARGLKMLALATTPTESRIALKSRIKKIGLD